MFFSFLNLSSSHPISSKSITACLLLIFNIDTGGYDRATNTAPTVQE